MIEQEPEVLLRCGEGLTGPPHPGTKRTVSHPDAGVAFPNDTQLAVTPPTGGELVYTLGPVELPEIAPLTRGFTRTECDGYGFATDCRTLDQLA